MRTRTLSSWCAVMLHLALAAFLMRVGLRSMHPRNPFHFRADKGAVLAATTRAAAPVLVARAHRRRRVGDQHRFFAALEIAPAATANAAVSALSDASSSPPSASAASPEHPPA